MSGPVSKADTAEVGEKDHEATQPVFERSPSRLTDVGGMPVRRALPRRQRRTIGAWCFVDHFGPAVASKAQMQVGPHPHIGLQTVTWVLEGEVLHRDSIGSEQMIRPGQLNLMTSGQGVAHAEEERFSANLHGVQLWVAQPEATRHAGPEFAHFEDLPRLSYVDSELTVLLGEIDGQLSPGRTDTALCGFAIEAQGRPVTIPLRKDFEYGVVVFDGSISIEHQHQSPGELVYLGCGRDELQITPHQKSRLLLIGGVPLHEELLMWWNFVARTKDEVAKAWEDWSSRADRFGDVVSSLSRIDAPPPPWVRRS